MNKKLKVIQLIDSLNPGGAEMMAVNIANGLADNGVGSYLCTTRLEGDLIAKISSDVGYLFLNKKSSLDISAFLRLKKFIKRNQISIIHAHSSSYFIAVLIKLVYSNVKIIWHDHYGNSENLKDRTKFPLKVMSNLFNVVISVNQLLEKWAIQNLSVKKIYVLSNFANFNSDFQKVTFLKGEEGKRIICLANLREQKDHINLLNAFKNIQKKLPTWTLHLVGVDLMDNYSIEIKSFISKYQLTNSIFLYGNRKDIPFILSQASIGVLSSKSEGLPVSLLEYGLAKLPVVVTDVGDCSNVVADDVNGLVVPPNNSKKLEEAILKLIKQGNSAKIMGEKLFEMVVSKFSKENYISKLIKIYN
ncbi:MAG: glycosyltransferase [Lutibacter sp.]|uniref:glycosyltransferase n=1 Tax=Lutibacter sp. TaxID=1925666 RepID=UPI00299DFAD3|nr:glycosyltransferase [Lutibacter sp.]MDX1828174.1 glycosyltransferase [Lutibacter sp.]